MYGAQARSAIFEGVGEDRLFEEVKLKNDRYVNTGLVYIKKDMYRSSEIETK